MLVWVLYFSVYAYVYVHCIQTNVCVPVYSANGIDDVALNKKLNKFKFKFVYFQVIPNRFQGGLGDYGGGKMYLFAGAGICVITKKYFVKNNQPP